MANIINKSNLIDFEKYIGVHLNKLQQNVDYLNSKINDDQNSFEGHDPIMGQSMQNRFINDGVKANVQKFSSSVGFRDMPPRHHNSSRLGVQKSSPDQRSTSYSKYSKPGHFDRHELASPYQHSMTPSALDTYYQNNSVKDVLSSTSNILKVLFMNCDELSRKFSNTHKEYEIMQELVTENEEHFIDLIENTDRFLQDLQDSGFVGQATPDDNQLNAQQDQMRFTYQTDSSNAQRYIKELDSLAGEYNTHDKKRLLDSQAYRTYSSAKSRDRGADVRAEFLNPREIALFDRINELQSELNKKENTASYKFEGVVNRLEKQLKKESQKCSEARRSYKVLAQTSMNFQSALKDLQKAVRSKTHNITSYKKIFDERSKQLTHELQKYKQLHKEKGEYSSDKNEIEFSSNSKRIRSVSPAGSTLAKSKMSNIANLSPTNLNRVYYESETNKKNAEIEKLLEEISKIKSQLEVQKGRRKELAIENDKMSQLLIQKESIINEKDEIILHLQKTQNHNKQKEGNQEDSEDEDNGALQIYKHRIENADAEINALKKQIRNFEKASHDMNLNNDDAYSSYRKKLQKEKAEVEELIDDTQSLIDSKIRNLNSRLSEKEKLLNKLIVDVRERIEAAKASTVTPLKQDYEQKITDLKLSHKADLNSLNNQMTELRAKLAEHDGSSKYSHSNNDNIANNQEQINELMNTIKKKTLDLKSKNDELLELNSEIEKKDNDILALNDQILATKSKHNKEVKDLKAEISKLTQDLESKNDINTE